MGRPKRSDEAGVIYHMLNRANRRATIFHKHEDFEAFERILAEALQRWQPKSNKDCSVAFGVVRHLATKPGSNPRLEN